MLTHDMKNLDKQISKWIYDRVHASPVLFFLSVVGAKYAIYVLGLMLVLITPDVFPLFTPISNDRIIRLAEIVGGVWLLTFLLQMIVRRKRPFECKLYEAHIPLMCKTPSFPSAHTSIAFALATISVNDFYWWTSNLSHISLSVALCGIGLYFLFAIWIALSRIAVGVHFFSDVIVGAILGYVIPMGLVYLAFKGVRS